MNSFQYRARTASGEEVRGSMEAADEGFVKTALFNQGLFPVLIQASSPRKKTSKIFNNKDLASFTKQFEVMFRVGMPIDKILETLAKQATHPKMQTILLEIQKDISGGMRLAEAFAKHPEYFNKLYISMIEMGQTAGVLDKTLKEMSLILRKEHDIHSKIKSALLYPKIVLFTLLVVTWAMLVFVFPPFKEFYAGQNATLPLPTLVVMGASEFVTTYWYMAVFTGVALYLTWRQIKTWPTVKHILSRLAFKIPVFGRLNLLSSNARFGHLVSALYRVGLPLPQTLAVVANTIANECYSQEVMMLKDSLEHGNSLSKGMEKTQYFSPMIKETCAVGEQTGKLDTTLDATASFYDSEIDELLRNLSTLIEPFMLFMLFGAVLLLALAVYLPIWNMSKVVLQ
jgi:type IV pilus assembly protein PilC